MKKRYGKWVDMTMINRDLEKIKLMMKTGEEGSKKMTLREDTQRRSCIVCGSKIIKPFITVHGMYKYVECEECGALTLLKYPDVKEMYSSDDSCNGDIYIDEAIYDKRVNMIAKPKADFILDSIKDFGYTPESWLDIGCGGGELLYYLNKQKQIPAEGMESDPAEIRFAEKKGLNIHNKFLDTKCIDSRIGEILSDKDVVSFFNVLEHIEHPVDYIEYLYENMKQDSFLVIEVPKHPSLASLANLTSLDHIYRHIVPPIHLQIFSYTSLKILLKDKFEIFSTWEFGQGFMDLVNNSMIISGLKENNLYEDCVKHSNEIQKAIDEAGLSDQILIVAKRV